MTILMRPRMLLRAVLCASLFMAAATSVSAQQGASITNQQRISDATRSLFDAVQANDLAAVQASVAAGADLAARDQWGLTPIDLAIDKSYFEVAHFLLSLRNFERTESASRDATPGSAAGFSTRAASAAGGSISARAKLPETTRAATRKQKNPPQQKPQQNARRQPVERWPSDQPNPFDPALPAPGAVLSGDGPGEAMRGDGYVAAERSRVQ